MFAEKNHVNPRENNLINPSERPKGKIILEKGAKSIENVAKSAKSIPILVVATSGMAVTVIKWLD